MADSGLPTHYLWLPNIGDAHAFVLFKVQTALQKRLRVMGNIRKRKKTPTTELKIFLLQKIFTTEFNKLHLCWQEWSSKPSLH